MESESDKAKRPSVAAKRAAFRKLHESGCFVLPNPWDIGSAKYLEHLGFKALATTSAGFAFSRGLPDYAVGRAAMLAHIRELVEATSVPLNADFENGFAHDAEGVARNVRLCADAGVAGLSIEDASGNASAPLYEMSHAIERIRAAREASGESGVLLVARTECFLVGRGDIDEAVQRLVAYADAGADCLYAPGIEDRADIVDVVKAVAPKPVNLLLSAPGGMSIEDAAALGVRRVSVGGALARAAWGGLRQAAQELAEQGTFGGFAEAIPHGELNRFFRGS